MTSKTGNSTAIPAQHGSRCHFAKGIKIDLQKSKSKCSEIYFIDCIL